MDLVGSLLDRTRHPILALPRVHHSRPVVVRVSQPERLHVEEHLRPDRRLIRWKERDLLTRSEVDHDIWKNPRLPRPSSSSSPGGSSGVGLAVPCQLLACKAARVSITRPADA